MFRAVHLGKETSYQDGFIIFSMVLRPFSRGSVRLASTDPFEQADLDVNYFSDQRDVDVMVDGMQLIELICRKFILSIPRYKY